MDDRSKIAEKIRALMARKVETGFTEEEALAAAKKIGELMYKYRLAMSDIEVQEEAINAFAFELDRKTRHPAFRVLIGIQVYCGIKTWYQHGKGIRITLFGKESDIAFARYLFDICYRAIDAEIERFKATETYLVSENKRGTTLAFANGMADRLSRRLKEMAAKESPTLKTATGTALVPLRNALVLAAFEKLKLKLKPETGSKARDPAAYKKGTEAGDKVTLNRGISGTKQKQIT